MNFNYTLGAMYCDDVRSEANGKIMLIGTYGDELVFQKYPAKIETLNAVFYLEYETCNDELETILMQLYKDDVVVAEYNGTIKKNPDHEPSVSKECIRGILHAKGLEFTHDSTLQLKAVINNTTHVDGPFLQVMSSEESN